ncbi:MAG: SDR family NAD(P)-dependent oxidoreductase [Ignavibacteriae bacterium]|nr:SDR family NAD(P)-dependent oxidoreductase [Ignavibacteriota bacterium]
MSEKVIWITGASTGIGREIAMEFSKAGHIIVATARRKSRLVNLVSEIKFAGREASAFVCNVASERSVQITAKRIREKYGRIDCLVNNAGVTVFKSFTDTKVYEFDYVMETNLRGAFLCLKNVLPQMIKNKRGHIINIISVAANTVYEDSSVYSASKAGLLALTNSIRKETRRYNIKISNILPGSTETAMWDSKTRAKYKNRMLSPSDIGKIVLEVFEQPKKVLVEDIIIRPIKGDI